MEKKYIEAKALKQNNKIVFVASDESTDRVGDVLRAEDWDLRNYKKAPRFFADHDHVIEKILGVGKVWIEGKKLMLEPKFHEITELARVAKRMVDEGVLNTVSVGFLPREDGKNELLEISLVGIPANANALMMKAMEKKIDEAQVKNINNFLDGEKPQKESKEETKELVDNSSKVKELESQLKELSKKTLGIESTIKSMSHPAPKQELVKARHQAKLTAAGISKLNAGLRALLKSYK